MVGGGGPLGFAELDPVACWSAGVAELVGVHRDGCLAGEEMGAECVQLGFEGEACVGAGAVFNDRWCPVGLVADGVGEPDEHRADGRLWMLLVVGVDVEPWGDCGDSEAVVGVAYRNGMGFVGDQLGVSFPQQ